MHTQDRLFLQIADPTLRQTLLSGDNLRRLLHAQGLDIPPQIALHAKTHQCDLQVALETPQNVPESLFVDVFWRGELLLQSDDSAPEQHIPMTCAMITAQSESLRHIVRHAVAIRRQLNKQNQEDTFVALIVHENLFDDDDWPGDVALGANKSTKRAAKISRFRQWLDTQFVTLWVVAWP